MNDHNYQETVMPKSRFSALESIYAWICFIAAYLFCRAFPCTSHPLGGFLLVVSDYIVSGVFMKLRGARLELIPTLVALSAVVLSAALILCDNSTIINTAYLYAIVSYFYFVYSGFGNRVKKGFSDLIFIDYFKALFLFPFSSFTALFKAIFSPRSKTGGRTVGKLLLGIAIAVIPTATVLALLSYDEGFREILRKLFDFSVIDIISHFISFHFAVPLAALCFGAFVSSAQRKHENVITAQEASGVSEKMKIAPLSTILAATIPVLFVYVIFFISQFKYYVSGFTGILPESFSYADYAREGFFQLCAVSVINLIILALVMGLARRKGKGTSAVIKLLCIVYSLVTLVLIATGIAKLVMYIDCYGLTPKRVYAAWLEIVLALIFVLIIFKQIIAKFNILITSFVIVTVCFTSLALSGVGSRIADYNISRYLDGSLETLDIIALGELGYESVPGLVKVYESITEDNEWRQDNDEYEILSKVKETLYWTKIKLERIEEHGDIFSYSLPISKAKQAIESSEINLESPDMN